MWPQKAANTYLVKWRYCGSGSLTSWNGMHAHHVSKRTLWVTRWRGDAWHQSASITCDVRRVRWSQAASEMCTSTRVTNADSLFCVQVYLCWATFYVATPCMCYHSRSATCYMCVYTEPTDNLKSAKLHQGCFSWIYVTTLSQLTKPRMRQQTASCPRLWWMITAYRRVHLWSCITQQT